MKISRYSCCQLSGSYQSSFDFNIYSRFKYGCVSSTEQLAYEMIGLVNSHLKKYENVVLTSSAYLNVPNAAACLLKTILKEYLNTDDKLISTTKLNRDQVFAFDYACLEHDQRTRRMQEISIGINYEEVAGKTLFVIDDAFVTGSHEQNIVKHLKNIPCDVVFFYLIEFEGYRSAAFENVLNSAHVSSLVNLLPIMKDTRYEINSRTLKYILSAEEEEFISFMSCLSYSFHQEIYKKAILDGYFGKNEGFTRNLRFIENLSTSEEYID